MMEIIITILGKAAKNCGYHRLFYNCFGCLDVVFLLAACGVASQPKKSGRVRWFSHCAICAVYSPIVPRDLPLMIHFPSDNSKCDTKRY